VEVADARTPTSRRHAVVAIDAARPAAPLPKGPVPTSMKGFRGQMRGR